MLTHACSLLPRVRFNWSRVLALSGTFSFHVAALVLMLMPLAPSKLPAVVLENLRPDDLPIKAKIHPPEEIKKTPLPPPIPKPPSRLKPATTKPITKPAIAAVPDVPIVSEAPIEPATPEVTPVVDPVSPGSSGDGKQSAKSVLSYAKTTKLSYPMESRHKREQGTVILRVLVNATGIPEKIEVEKSSGYPRLDRAAQDAIKHWRFHPESKDGISRSTWGLVPIAFRLDEV